MQAKSAPRSKRQYVHGLNSDAMRLARSLLGVKQKLFPGFIEPALATMAHRPPRGEQWLHEIKFDGYRFQCHIQRNVRFYTRRGNDWSKKLRHLIDALSPLSDRSAILDGEVVVETPEGLSDFHALEKELAVKGGSDRLVYYVFDILYLGGFDLREAALLDRKRVLQALLSGIDGPIKFSEHIEGDGLAIWRRACQLSLEGLVSKRADSKYASDERTPYWIKVPCRQRDTFAIVGWSNKNGKFDGVYLGRIENGGTQVSRNSGNQRRSANASLNRNAATQFSRNRFKGANRYATTNAHYRRAYAENYRSRVGAPYRALYASTRAYGPRYRHHRYYRSTYHPVTVYRATAYGAGWGGGRGGWGNRPWRAPLYAYAPRWGGGWGTWDWPWRAGLYAYAGTAPAWGGGWGGWGWNRPWRTPLYAYAGTASGWGAGWGAWGPHRARLYAYAGTASRY